MRQLKNLMKAKKPMWRCGECKCVTLQCWRDNDEFCNCGEQMTFMTYEELVALGSVDAIVNELNKNPSGYLNSLTEEWHTQQSPEPGIELYVIVSHPDTPLIIDNKGFAIIMHSDDPDLPTPLNTWVAIPYGPQPVPPTTYTITFGEDDGWLNSITQEPVTSRTVPAGTKLTLGRLDYDIAEIVIWAYPTEEADPSEYELIDRFVNTSWIKVNWEYLMFREPIEVNEDVTVTIDGDESLYELELEQFGWDVWNWVLWEYQEHIAISEWTPVTLTNQEWNTVTITAGSYSATYTLSDESYHIASVITTDDPDDPQATQYEVGTAIPFFTTMRATVVVEPSL